MSMRSNPPAAAALDTGTSPKREVILLGEAIDLVTLAQGYASPAVPLLLQALIRGIRELDAVPNEHGPEAQPVERASDGEPPQAPSSQPESEKAAEAPAAPSEPAPENTAEEAPARAEGPQRYEVLEKQFKDADRKLSALTTAVGQLVDALQRRTRSGGVDRRGFPRVAGGNAKVTVRGNAYQVVNWSRSGFLIRIAESDRFSRGSFDYHFVLELPDETIQFQGRASPVRIERTLLAAEFAGLDEATGDKMAEIASRLTAAPI